MKKNIIISIILFCFIFINNFQQQLTTYALENNTSKIFCNVKLSDEFAEDRVLLVLNEKTNLNSKVYSNYDFAKYNCEYVEDLTPSPLNLLTNKRNKRVLSLKLSNVSKSNVLNTIEELIKREDVLYAGPDYKICTSATMPNDYYSNLQWAIENIQLPKAWNFTTGSDDVIVGVLDTGIDGTHQDIEKSIIKEMCRDFTSGEEVLELNPIDPNGHGTHVAGIIGAIGNNNLGITGTNWNVGLASLRIFDSFGNGYISYVAEAIKYAEKNSIPILNLSGRWYENSNKYDMALNEIIKSYSGLLICAAGNENKNNDESNPSYPASYKLDNIISVVSIDNNCNKSSTSNYGANSVDIFAPGENIYSTIPNGSYKYYSGTSMATPYVSGVAALVLSLNSNLTASQLKEAILNSVDIPNINGQNPLKNYCVTGGKLNAYNAITYALENYALDSHMLGYKTIINVDKTIEANELYFVQKNAMIKLSKNNNYMFKFSISSNLPIKVVMYKQNFDEMIVDELISSNNGCSFEFNITSSFNICYLKINYVNPKNSGKIKFNIHHHYYEDHYCIGCNQYIETHDYHAPYKWLSFSKHSATCGCGVTIQQGHIVSNSETVFLSIGTKYKTCLLCGGSVEIGFVQIDSTSLEIQYVTENGSYILPNGVVVLMDEDMENLMNKTLIFTRKDNNSII